VSVRHSTVALVCVLLLASSIPRTAVAQEDEPTPIIYATYFQCDPAQSQRASEILRDSWGPIAQARIDSGALTAWGSLTHHTGGEWSRAVYHVAMDRAGLFTTLDEMGTEWQNSDPEAVAEFWDACEEHEDYVWSYVDGSDPVTEVAQDRATAGLSIYWVCDEGRGALANMLAEQVFAPAWDAQVESGLINSWSWFAHFLGGKYRRLLVADGASHEALLTARDNVIEWIGDNSPGLAGEFSNVCNGHTDYLWDVEIAAP
jgi:hypothetical protein